MHLRDLSLTQFRAHTSTSFPAAPGVNLIVGPNGAGKTNLLEAVSVLSPGRGLRRVAAAEMGRRDAGVGWKVTAAVAGHEVETWAEPDAARQVRIDGKAAAQTGLTRLLSVVWLVPVMDRLWIEGADGRRRFLDRMTMGFAADHAEAALTYEKAMRERNRLLKDEVRDPAWYRALEGRMAEAGAVIDANRRAAIGRVTAAQEGAATAFPAAELALVGPEGEEDALTAEGLAAAFADGRGRDMAAGRTLAGPHRSDLTAVWAEKGIPAREGSTGEQKALLISLVLSTARALARDEGRAPVILLDEVAAHLDEGRRRALYDEIAALGAQAWMTGTGPELFEALGDRAQRLRVEETGGASRVVAE